MSQLKWVTIQENLSQLSAQQLDKDYPELASVLGLLILTEYPELQQYIAQDSVFITHLNMVQTALQAYQDNREDTLNETLQQLPYRSAFRDLRTVLSAVISMPGSIEKGGALLAKIPANSAYASIAQLLLTSIKNGSALVQEMVLFNHQQRAIIGDIKSLIEHSGNSLST